MELKYFRLVKTIAEEGSLVGSSEKLFLTQSALSHQLRDLEERLGFKVFYRTRKKWTLTEEGAELYKLANQLFQAIDDGFSNIEQIREGSKGTIRLSTECYSFYQGVPGLIQRMALLYPEIKIELVFNATHQPVSKVLSNEIDIAIVTTRPQTDVLRSIAIFEDEIFAVLHKENQLSGQAFLEATDFSRIHLIIHSFPLETVSVHEHFLKPNDIQPAKISAIPFTELAIEMVNSNMGVMCLPKWRLETFRLPENLVFKRISKEGLKRTHYLTYRAEDRNKKYINDFVQCIEEDFMRKC